MDSSSLLHDKEDPKIAAPTVTKSVRVDASVSLYMISRSLIIANGTASVERVPNWDNDRSQSGAMAVPCGHLLQWCF